MEIELQEECTVRPFSTAAGPDVRQGLGIGGPPSISVAAHSSEIGSNKLACGFARPASNRNDGSSRRGEPRSGKGRDWSKASGD